MYFILQGSALIIIGNTKYKVSKGNELIISPNIAHFTIPNKCVMAVVNIPPFNAENYFVLTETNTSVQFDYVEFKKLISSL